MSTDISPTNQLLGGNPYETESETDEELEWSDVMENEFRSVETSSSIPASPSSPSSPSHLNSENHANESSEAPVQQRGRVLPSAQHSNEGLRRRRVEGIRHNEVNVTRELEQTVLSSRQRWSRSRTFDEVDGIFGFNRSFFYFVAGVLVTGAVIRYLPVILGSSFKFVFVLIGTIIIAIRFCAAVHRRAARLRQYRGYTGHQRLDLLNQFLGGHYPGLINNPHLRLALIDRDFNENDYEALLALDEDTPTRHCRAAPPELISNLPSYDLTEETFSELSDKSCSICLEGYELGSQMKTMPCLHQFHDKCLNQWLKVQATCPICKFDLRS